MPLSRPLIAFMVGSILLAPVASAQDDQQRFAETIEVRVVNVDVVVTDRSGKPIPNLRREDFELFVDGQPTPITNFSRVIEGRLDDEASPPTDVAQQPAEPPTREPLTWAVFVDQTNVNPGRRNQALAQLRGFLDRALQEGDQGVVALFDGEAFQMKRGVTTDRNVLLQTLETLQRERANMGPSYAKKSMLRREIELCCSDPMDLQRIVDQVYYVVEEEAVRATNAIAALGTLVDAVSGVEGRLAFVYIGAGLTTLPGMEIVEVLQQKFPQTTNDISSARPEEWQAKLERETTRIFDRISATRATLYAIYAGTPGGVSAEDQGTLDVGGGVVGDRAMLTQMGLAREMADRTGGLFFNASPQLDRQLDAVRSDLSHYYSLGYSPKASLGKAQRIRIAVKIEGARVRHRESARERTAEEEAQDAVVTALFDPAIVNPLGVAVDYDAPRRASKGSGTVLPVRVKIPLQSLSFLREATSHRGGVSFHFALAGDDGTIWRLDSRELPLEIPQAEFKDAMQKLITYSIEVPLRRKKLRLALSVQDRIALVRSIVTVPLSFETLKDGG